MALHALHNFLIVVNIINAYFDTRTVHVIDTTALHIRKYKSMH